MDDIAKSLLKVSSVENGVLALPGLDREQMEEVYELLSSAIMDCKVPHYKVIGVKISGDCGQVENVTTKIANVGKSYTEVFKCLESLVFAEGGGAQSLEKDFDSKMLMGKGFIVATDVVTSSNKSMRFAGEANREVLTLVEDEKIVSLTGGLVLQLIIQKGTGMLDFDVVGKRLKQLEFYNYDTNKNLSSSIRSLVSGYMPLRVVYDLNTTVLLKPYHRRDKDVLRFLYRRRVNEDVLSRIIAGYAETL